MRDKPPQTPEREPDAVQLPRHTNQEMIRIMIEKDPELVAQKLREFLKNK